MSHFLIDYLVCTVDEYCKDSLEIVDVMNRRTLYRGCSELSRPIQVQSLSNSVEVSLKSHGIL